MKRMSSLTDKFEAGITLFTQMIVSFLVEKKYKNLMPRLHEICLPEVNVISL